MSRAACMSAVVLLLVLVLAAVQPASAQPRNLLKNGDFETNGFSHWKLSSSCKADSVVCKPSLANTGSCAAQLGSSEEVCDLSQPVELAADKQYELSFYVSADFQNDYNTFTVTAQIGDGALQTLLSSQYITGGYAHYTFILQSTDSKHNPLKLSFDSEDDYGFLYLDTVSLSEYFPPPPPAATRFLVNGGFETGTFYGWTIGPDCINQDEVASEYVHSGSYSAQFSNYPDVCTLSQDVTLVRGKSYQLSFWLLSTVYYYYPAQFSLSTELGNSSQLLFSQSYSYDYYYYLQFSYVVTAPVTGAHTLGLTFGSAAQEGNLYLDDVVLTELRGHEPSSALPFSSSALPFPNISETSSSSFDFATSTPAPPSGHNLLVNGGFESGAFAPGWTLANCTDTSVYNADPHSGVYAAALGSYSPCVLSQDVQLTGRKNYTLSYFLMSDGGAANELIVTVELGKQSVQTLFSEYDLSSTSYTQYSFTFETTSGGKHSLQLSFTSEDQPGLLRLDDVSLVIDKD